MFRLILVFSLALLLSATGEPVIAEFMASNRTTLKDGHGTYSDWIEIWNEGSTPVNLQGWKLTDSASDLSKFTFPSVNLAGGQRLVVFCASRSGSTGAATYLDPLGYLHTNFALSASGEYLALVRPDGSIRTQFSPSFPAQTDDLSFGAAEPSAALIGSETKARYVVPTTTGYDTASPNWRANSFTDSAWPQAAGSGLGFESGLPIAYWPLDETAGSTTAADATGSGFNGSASGSATFGATG
jgi:hypothetical protein